MTRAHAQKVIRCGEGGVRGGATRWPSTNRRAAGGVTATQPIRARSGRGRSCEEAPPPPPLRSGGEKNRRCPCRVSFPWRSVRGSARSAHRSPGDLFWDWRGQRVRSVWSWQGGRAWWRAELGVVVVLIAHEFQRVSTHGGTHLASLRPADFGRLDRPDHTRGSSSAPRTRSKIDPYLQLTFPPSWRY